MRFLIIYLSVFLLLLFSCKENKKQPVQQNKKEALKSISSSLKKEEGISVRELENFYNQIINTCNQENESINENLSSVVLEKYPEFCDMLKDAITNKEGDIQFDIEENGEGIISINSAEVIEVDGEKYTNEYSTFLYINKINNKLTIKEVGGAG